MDDQQRAHITIFGFGVRFELFFWVMAVVMGIRFGGDRIEYAALWFALVTVSILVHELGHAFAYRYYGAKARIAMTGFGGLTYGSDAQHLGPKDKIVVSLAGVTVQMALLGFPAWILQRTWSPDPWSWWALGLDWLWWINVVWALINLLPVWPMDGGQVVEQFFILRGRPQKRKVHKISIATGIVSAAGWWYYDVRFAAFMFLFFVVLNLFALQVFKTKTPVQLWPGVDTRSGTSREWEHETAAAKPLTRQDHLRQGYAALLDERTHDTDAELERFVQKSKRATKKEHSLAQELEVWRHFTAGRVDRAESTFESVGKPSSTLKAVMSLQQGACDVAPLAAAIRDEAEHPASEQGVVWAAKNGYIEAVVRELLVSGGTAGLGHAVRIESLLANAGLDEERQKVEALI